MDLKIDIHVENSTLIFFLSLKYYSDYSQYAVVGKVKVKYKYEETNCLYIDLGFNDDTMML